MVPGILAAFALQPDPAMLRRIYEEALERSERQYGSTDARMAQAARDLGLFLAREGHAADARRALAEAVRIDEALRAEATLADVAELAAVSPPAEAEPLWRRAAESSNARVAARALAALGDARARAGDRTAAAGFYRRALAKEEAGGKQSEAVALRLNALAHVVEIREGIALLERALAIERRALGARHPETASTAANLAGLLVNAGRNEEAIQAAGPALAVFQETLAPDHPRCAVTATILGFAYAGQGRSRTGGENVSHGGRHRRARLRSGPSADGERSPDPAGIPGRKIELRWKSGRAWRRRRNCLWPAPSARRALRSRASGDPREHRCCRS